MVILIPDGRMTAVEVTRITAGIVVGTGGHELNLFEVRSTNGEEIATRKTAYQTAAEKRIPATTSKDSEVEKCYLVLPTYR